MPNHVLIYAEAVDVATEGAVWYARRIGRDGLSALHVAGKHTDTGINARWFDLTDGEPRLDVRPPGTDATEAVLDAVRALRRNDDDVITLVLPEQFSKRSLMAAASYRYQPLPGSSRVFRSIATPSSPHATAR